MTQPDTAPTNQSADEVVGKLVGWLGGDALGTGPLAELRRLDPTQRSHGAAALHRLLARTVPDDWLGGEALHRWTLVVHLLALAAPEQHRGGGSLGAALFAADYSEGRLTRLLAAREAEFEIILPRMVRFVVAKGERLNPYHLAWFVLGQGTEADRMRIARDYYRAEAKQQDAA